MLAVPHRHPPAQPRRCAPAHGVVELAFDDGVIVAGERRLRGVRAGDRIGQRLAARGDRHRAHAGSRATASGSTPAARPSAATCWRAARRWRAARKARAGRAARRLRAWRRASAAVLLSCLEQVSVNASQVASGELRRRARAPAAGRPAPPAHGAALFYDASLAGWPLDELTAEAAALFRALGAARDQRRDRRADPARAATQALQAAGAAARSAGADAAGGRDAARRRCCASAAVRRRCCSTCWRWLQPAPPSTAMAVRAARAARPPARPLAPQGARRRAALRRSSTMPAATRCASASSACATRSSSRATLFPKRRVRRYLKPLRALQERLGALIDVTRRAATLYASGQRRDPHGACSRSAGWRRGASDAAQATGRTRAEPVFGAGAALLDVGGSARIRRGASGRSRSARYVSSRRAPRRSPSAGSASSGCSFRSASSRRTPGAHERAVQLLQRVEPRGVHRDQAVHLEHHARACRPAAASASASSLRTAPKKSEPYSSHTITPGGAGTGVPARRGTACSCGR